MRPPDEALAFRPPEAIETPRLILRRPVREDAQHLFAAYTTDIEAVRYLTWRPHTQLEQTVDYVNRCSSEWEGSRNFPFVILERADTTTPVGMIRLRRADHATSFGYVVARPYWGRGFVTEALSALLDWSLAQPGIFRAWASCDVDNPASARVMEKAGMCFEGVFRRFSVHPNISAEPRDSMIYAKVVP